VGRCSVPPTDSRDADRRRTNRGLCAASETKAIPGHAPRGAGKDHETIARAQRRRAAARRLLGALSPKAVAPCWPPKREGGERRFSVHRDVGEGVERWLGVPQGWSEVSAWELRLRHAAAGGCRGRVRCCRRRDGRSRRPSVSREGESAAAV
jgi:hypothetical protein